ncbi:neuronal PAS domain protein [Perilla frutescens var. hirtella]|uniref:Neuronal PAS domain protein n=1 Tax=Perilla frutescens var. hirtella TaxID=608512 RepID=A0AAD4JQD0_PERFH|nr:neuronal PAS domain protein [Perilla frutescens var. hirtella]KAH6837469.1 neuronal PAS domain protein [Perilla frutescens var. hirtella]
MAFSSFPDVFSWIQKLPPIQQWETPSKSLNLCPSCSSHPSLKLSLTNLKNTLVSLSIIADYNLPISLWTSKKISPNPMSKKLLDHDGKTVSTMLTNFIEDVLKYCSNKAGPSSVKLPQTYLQNNIGETFNFSFLTLTFVVCIYEAPTDLRASCLHALKEQLACPRSRGVSKLLMRQMGSNIEERWMRSVNLAITNWISELQAARAAVETPSPLFSYSFSTLGLWKVQLYCPVIAMNVEKSSGSAPDDRLTFSLNYHQLEGVIQLNYKVAVQEKWIEIRVNTDNIRCDVVKLLTDSLMSERGAGASEKHFPSRIGLQITPAQQASVISVSVSKSSENASREIGQERGIEAAFEPPSSIGLHFSAGESYTTSLRPWKFEPSVYGNTANLNWFLHDSEDGREVFSSKPSKLALLHPKAWFKNRYSNANRPFTRQGGVIFAGDEYGESVSWKLDKTAMGRLMDWEIKGWIWLTYWPNQHRTFYTETKRLDFTEIVHLNLT